MAPQVVVLGAGYAGAGAVRAFEDEVRDGEADLVWISDHDYHLILHEVHRVVRDPSVESKITIPVDEIKSPDARFVEGHVEGVDVDERVVELADGRTVDYDYLLVGLGTRTAFYGIDGLREHAHTLKSLDDARQIHEDLKAAVADATDDDPARAVVGGAGLSGIQVAGEMAEFRDRRDAPLDITLVEGLDDVLPGSDPSIQKALRGLLEDRGVDIRTGDFVSGVVADRIYLGGDVDEEPTRLPYDVFVWTGGITGHDELADAGVAKDDRTKRIYAETNLQTSDERVFAIGDTAMVDQGPDQVAPTTAQAAWQAAEVAGENLVRAVRGEPLETWRHVDKGTVVSVGEDAVAHNVQGVPVSTFGGFPAKLLKKGIAARWITTVCSLRRAVRAWPHM